MKRSPRSAKIETEADQIFAISDHPELAAGPPIPADVISRYVERGLVRVAVVDNTLAGFVLLTRSEDEPCIGQISVRKSFGGCGIGTMLLTHVIDEARESGETGVVLNTQRDVPWNAPWYERHGFRVVEEPDWTEDMRVIAAEQCAAGLDWSTRVHMRLIL